MNLEHHIKVLPLLCRTCGERLTAATDRNSPKFFDCSKYKDKLQGTFHIDVTEDDPEIHPQHFCLHCYSRSYMGKPFTAKEWMVHPRTGPCNVCLTVEQQKKGGRSKKFKSPGRKKKCISPADHLEQLSCGPKVDVHDSYQFRCITKAFLCGLCNSIVNEALESPCQHLFCKTCVKAKYQNDIKFNCPVCKTSVKYLEITSPRAYFAAAFLRQECTCVKCKATLPMSDEGMHDCQSDIAKMMSRPLDAPPTPSMEALGSHILKTKLQQSEDGMAVSFKTGGLPLTAICMPKPRVDSGAASQATVRRRSKLLERARDIVSGGASAEQLRHEISKSSNELQTGLQGINNAKVMISAEEFLSLKADMGSSWKRNRELKRWLKKYGVHTKCERKLREQQDNIIGNNLQGEWLPFLFDNEEGTIVKQTPCASVKDLKRKIIQQIDGYDRLGMLKWHEAIPTDEIWVKIGGDKGGATFKEMFQVANIDSPNAPRNTVVFCAFPASDSIYNLKLAFESLKQQVNDLQESSWRDKKFRIFAFGDYEYLCKMYGLAGASGRHCCLWCNRTKIQMRQPPTSQTDSIEARTLQTLQRDLQNFRKDGSKPDRMKNFNNVIEEPLFDIPLEQVCIPGLHISLGLFLKHFNSYEHKLHELDIKLASTMNLKDVGAILSTQNFEDTCKALTQARALEQQAEDLNEAAMLLREHLIGLSEDDPNTTIYSAMITDHLKEKDKLLKESQVAKQQIPKLKRDDGPIVRKLEEKLQLIKVHRQAYHGRSFVGNHVHRCCQKENIDKLMSVAPDVVGSLCPQLLPEANSIATKYRTLFRLFSVCHKQINVCSVLSDEDIQSLELTIKGYMAYFRQEFPDETIPPKMHMLEYHTIPFIRQWKVGLGFHGEQGGESVHARLNSIRRDIRGLKDELATLMSVMTTHWVQTRPGAQ